MVPSCIANSLGILAILSREKKKLYCILTYFFVKEFVYIFLLAKTVQYYCCWKVRIVRSVFFLKQSMARIREEEQWHGTFEFVDHHTSLFKWFFQQKQPFDISIAKIFFFNCFLLLRISLNKSMCFYYCFF